MMNKRGGDYDYGMGGGKRARGGLGSKIGLRVMVPSKMAGCLIGKGGQNIQNLRNEYKCNIRIPDCPGPERIMEITADDWESVFDCLAAAIPWLYECPNGVDDGSQKELRFLVNQAVIGGIIGKGGEKIKDIRSKSGASVKVFQSPAPQSTDRCVQTNGTLEKLLLAAREIYQVVQNSESHAMEELYDPINYDNFFANEYGGYGSGADQKRMPPRGRGGMPMGGGRGMPMGRGGPMGFGGMDYEMRDPPSLMAGLRGGRGGFRGGPGGSGFGRGGFGMGFGDNEWGGGFGGGMGGGSGPELKFSPSESETTQVTITNDMAGAIIGPGGQRIRKIRNDSKANVTIGEPDSTTKERVITIAGNPESIQMAQYLLQQSVREHSSGGGYY